MTQDAAGGVSPDPMARISRVRPSDDPSWMAQLDDLTDADVESLLHGTLPSGAESLAPVAEVALLLRTRALGEPVPAMSPTLRAQLDRDAAVTPLAARRTFRRSARVGVGAAVLAIAGVTGAAAASNSLPAQVQDAVSSAADLVGVEVPRSGDTGYDGGETPGGAVPADPGTPGDKEPATPAVPPQPQADVRTAAGGDDGPGPVPQSSAGGSNAQGNPTPGPVDTHRDAGGDSSQPGPVDPPEPDRGPPESDERGDDGSGPSPATPERPGQSGLPAPRSGAG